MESCGVVIIMQYYDRCMWFTTDWNEIRGFAQCCLFNELLPPFCYWTANEKRRKGCWTDRQTDRHALVWNYVFSSPPGRPTLWGADPGSVFPAVLFRLSHVRTTYLVLYIIFSCLYVYICLSVCLSVCPLPHMWWWDNEVCFPSSHAAAGSSGIAACSENKALSLKPSSPSLTLLSPSCIYYVRKKTPRSTVWKVACTCNHCTKSGVKVPDFGNVKWNALLCFVLLFS